MYPLEDISVLDFSTLLPGPFARLMSADAGAKVIKIERPVSGDEMRDCELKLGADSTDFHRLNAGKDSTARANSRQSRDSCRRDALTWT